MREGHAAEAIAEVIIQTLQDYNIEENLGYITTENASENDVLCRLISTKLKDWPAAERRLRCFGHVINLTVQAFLFGKNEQAVEAAAQLSQLDIDATTEQLSAGDKEAGYINFAPLQKILTSVTVVRASDRRHNDFKDLCDGLTIHKPNDTRWNSHFDCFESAYKLGEVYSSSIRQHPELEDHEGMN